MQGFGGGSTGSFLANHTSFMPSQGPVIMFKRYPSASTVATSTVERKSTAVTDKQRKVKPRLHGEELFTFEIDITHIQYIHIRLKFRAEIITIDQMPQN